MALVLVDAEDVCENVVQPTETTIPKEEIITEEEKTEFEINDDLKVVLEDVLDLATGGMELHDYKKCTFAHPTKDYDVEYFIKGKSVIMLDYHGTNIFKIEVLGREDADIVIDNIKGVS